MDVLILAILFVIAAAVVLLVSAPLRHSSEVPPLSSAERDELEAAREALYREIRDAELDYRTGKLSRDDYETIDGDLRARALTVLDRLGEEDPEGSAPEGTSQSPRG
ncbi:MAG TPA: hypothetical protein VH025_06465 [Solirubrobacteraceae bacterium]|nr:hypothetical protein [Solirubrobacteraceae bacterium]